MLIIYVPLLKSLLKYIKKTKPTSQMGMQALSFIQLTGTV